MPDEGIDEQDERLAIPLDPEVALRALLKVDPDAEPAAHVAVPEERCPKTSMGKRCVLKAGHFGPCQYLAP
jgi:hypothetical protein